MFDLQRFDDTLTSSRELKLLYEFEDGDTRTTTLPNPKTNLTATDVATCSTTLANTQAFVGDKANAAFTKISSAIIVNQTRRELDLSGT